MTAHWNRIETLFLEALERSGEERSEYLRLECAEDSALLDEIQAMLHAHESTELSVERRLLAPSDSPAETDIVGQHVGPYRLLSIIGRGGMGEVYLAERDDDLYERRVAVKLVHPGPGRSLRRRFEQERQILARLMHPNVATLHDGGVAQDGRPYLVMEYVDGRAITDYCDENRLSLRGRLDLFITVCETVQFAHEALVVHRDLKPSNIFIDEHGSVKLLDFGIAWLLEEEVPDAERTSALDRVLTPEHAAPEQIRGEEPTTATDVYALGVLLCELLAGGKPIRFPTRSPVEIDRIAREVEPTLPTKILSDQSREEQGRLAERRSTTPEQLRRFLRGDLDAICARALRKNTAERYRSPAALGEDLRRHFESRPVHAARGNRAYRIRKYMRRYRMAIVTTTLAILVATAFSANTLVQARRVRVERDRAQQASARADQVLEKLIGLFESTRPDLMPGPEKLDVTEFLRRGAETAELLHQQPDVQSRMYEVLAEIHAARSEIREAAEMAKRARTLTDDPVDRARLDHQYAVLVSQRDGPEAALPLLRASLAAQRAQFGEPSLMVAQAMQDLGSNVTDFDEARRLLEGAIAMRVQLAPADRRSRASGLNALATLELVQSNFDVARRLLEESDSLLAELMPATAAQRMTVRHNLAAVYTRLGEWELGASMQKELVDARREIYGPDSEYVGRALESHAVTLANLGRHRESAEAFSEVLSIFEEHLGDQHWRVANSARNVGQLLAMQGRYEEALPYLDRAIDIHQRLSSPSQSVVYLRGQRAMILLGLGQVDRARGELTEVADALADSTAEFSPAYVADGQLWLGIAHLRADDNDAARRCFARALEIRVTILPADHVKVAEARCGLSLCDAGDSPPADQEAIRRYREWGLAHPLLLELLTAAGR